jgi:hypothetical protein
VVYLASQLNQSNYLSQDELSFPYPKESEVLHIFEFFQIFEHLHVRNVIS